MINNVGRVWSSVCSVWKHSRDSRTLVITTDNWDSYNHIHTQITHQATKYRTWRIINPQKTARNNLIDQYWLGWQVTMTVWRWPMLCLDSMLNIPDHWLSSSLTNNVSRVEWPEHWTLPLQETIFYEYLKYGMENKMGRWGELCVVVWCELSTILLGSCR